MATNEQHERIFFEDIEELVEKIIRKIGRPYPSDITDQVFIAIEENREYMRLYNLFSNGKFDTINPMIGKCVKDISGLKVKGTCRNPESKLIKTYTILGI